MTLPADNFCPAPPAAKEVQDRRQLIGGCIKGSLAHTRWRPQLLTGLFRGLITAHFSDANNIEEPDLRKLIWEEGPATGILVESVYRYRADNVEKRPAVLIKRNNINNVRITTNDLYGADARGFEHFITLWVGSHTIFVIGGTGAATEILSTEVARELTEFGPAIRTELRLEKYQVLEIGEIGILEEAKQNFVIPITVGWAYDEAWMLKPEALTLMGGKFVIEAADC